MIGRAVRTMDFAYLIKVIRTRIIQLHADIYRPNLESLVISPTRFPVCVTHSLELSMLMLGSMDPSRRNTSIAPE